MYRTDAILQCSMLVLGVILSALTLTEAQEVEPNNTCPNPQDLGQMTLPITVTGSLDTPPAMPDIDFFKVTLPEATEQLVQVELAGQDTGLGTLSDPFLGVFDATCQIITFNDDSGSLNSRVLVVVPVGGVLILAATSCCDDGFIGNGDSSGSYQLTVELAPPPIDAISGRVVNAFTGLPLRGDAPTFALVELFRCRNGACVEFITSQSTDFAGRFRFDRDDNGQPLLAGTYQVGALAEGFQRGQTEPFEVESGEARDLGDLPLAPPPIQVSNVQPCVDLPAQGGPCRYRLTAHNVSLSRFEGAAWSLVQGFSLGSVLDFTLWQTGASDAQSVSFQSVGLDPGEQTVLEFDFDVPPTVAAGASLCVEVFVGQDPSPRWNTVTHSSLFCVSKGSDGLVMKPAEQAQQRRQRLRRASGPRGQPRSAQSAR